MMNSYPTINVLQVKDFEVVGTVHFPPHGFFFLFSSLRFPSFFLGI